MKKIWGSTLFTSAVAFSMMLSACGSDSSSSSSNVERAEGGESSSVEESISSSSAEDESSSSEKKSSSSEESKKEDRVATSEDLPKNVSLGKVLGTEVFLATGNMQGVISMWVLNKDGSEVGWAVARSEFKDGTFEFDPQKGSFIGASVPEADSLRAFFNKGGKIQFKVNAEDTLLVSVNGGEFQNADVISVQSPKTRLSKVDSLQSADFKCDNGQLFKFYKDRYVLEETVNDSVHWSAGYYDIQRGHLLMLPVFFNTRSITPLLSAQVNANYSITMDTGDRSKIECEKSTFKYTEMNRGEMVGSWDGSDSLEWTLVLGKDGSYSVTAKDAGVDKESKSGIWDVYGDQLMLENTGCRKPETCTSAVKGKVEGFDAKVGFTYNHNDGDSPAVPTVWTLPQTE